MALLASVERLREGILKILWQSDDSALPCRNSKDGKGCRLESDGVLSIQYYDGRGDCGGISWTGETHSCPFSILRR